MALTLVLGSCAGVGLITPPDLTLVDVSISDVTVFETTGEFTIRLVNVNPDPLTIEGAVFTLFLNGLKVGRGVTSEVMEVPNLGDATQSVTFYLSNLALATRVVDMLEKPVLDYRLKTKLRLRVPYGIRRLKTVNEGQLNFDRESVD